MYTHPKIFQLGTSYTTDIFNEEVEITEKIDGSQFRFGLDDSGELQFYSRGGQLHEETLDKLFIPAVEFAKSIDFLERDHMYYGETLCRNKHNVLNYGRVPKNNFALFGISTLKNTCFYPRHMLENFQEQTGCDVVPLLFKGVISDLTQVKPMLDGFLAQESYLGNCKMEGVVIRNIHRGSMVIPSVTFPITCAKYVSEAFKERHAKDENWKPKGDQAEWAFVQYKTEARWVKAIQHLTESGEIEGSPKDIGKLLKEITEDIIKDHKQEICEELWKIFSPKFKGVWTHGFPQYYKDSLLNKMIDDKSKPKE